MTIPMLLVVCAVLGCAIFTLLMMYVNQRSITKKLRDEQAELEQQVAALPTIESRVLADLAHELRTPLAAVRSAVSFAALAHPADEQLAAVDAQAASLHERLEALLLMARLTLSSKELKGKTEIISEDVIDAAWNEAIKAEQKSAELVKYIAQAKLQVHPDLFRLLLVNAFSNSLQHGTDNQISVAIKPFEDEARQPAGNLLVIRNGTHLNAGEWNQAFETMWRGDQSRSHSNHGGLGMSLIRRIVEAHGGTAQATVEDEQFILSCQFPG